MRTANIYIDATALNHNVNQITQRLAQVKKTTSSVNLKSPTKLMVMLKANAYGHGIDACTLALLDNQNVQAVGVATMEEALQIKNLGWQRTIVLIEGVFSQQEWQTAIHNNIQVVIHHQQQLNWALETQTETQDLANLANSATRTIWLKLNTGMNRLGFSQAEILAVSHQLNDAGYQQILTSHFANADDKAHPLNAKQGAIFQQTLTQLHQQVNPHIQGSLCNSAGLVNFPEWHYDWVRAGIMAYGSSPIIDQTAKQLNLLPVMTLSSKIMAIHQIDTGDMVGYGSRWIAQKPSLIAIVSIGYGDGYPRVVDESACVSVVMSDADSSQVTCPIIGRVAMDMIVIDISHIHDSHIKNSDTPLVHIDSQVILWGDSPHIDQVANSANTIGYELLCRLTTRPKRISKHTALTETHQPSRSHISHRPPQ